MARKVTLHGFRLDTEVGGFVWAGEHPDYPYIFVRLGIPLSEDDRPRVKPRFSSRREDDLVVSRGMISLSSARYLVKVLTKAIEMKEQALVAGLDQL